MDNSEVPTMDAPVFVEDLLGEGIEAKLYVASNIDISGIPPQKRSKIMRLQQNPTITDFPFIGWSFEPHSHLYVVGLRGDNTVTIDNDGQLYNGLRYNLNGFISIKESEGRQI